MEVPFSNMAAGGGPAELKMNAARKVRLFSYRFSLLSHSFSSFGVRIFHIAVCDAHEFVLGQSWERFMLFYASLNELNSSCICWLRFP